MFSARRDLVFLALCGVVFALDVVAGSQVSPWSLYLLPVCASGWLFGGRHPYLVALLSVALIGLAALISGHPFQNHAEFVVSWGNRTVSLLCVAWLSGFARRSVERDSIRRALRQNDH
jgi:hypothetical protein